MSFVRSFNSFHSINCSHFAFRIRVKQKAFNKSEYDDVRLKSIATERMKCKSYWNRQESSRNRAREEKNTEIISASNHYNEWKEFLRKLLLIFPRFVIAVCFTHRISTVNWNSCIYIFLYFISNLHRFCCASKSSLFCYAFYFLLAIKYCKRELLRKVWIWLES